MVQGGGAGMRVLFMIWLGLNYLVDWLKTARQFNYLGNYTPKTRKSTQLTCKACGRSDKFDFHVPDELWQAIVPLRFQGHVVCLCCFDDFAKEKDINYSSSLQTLYFAGNKATFRFEVAWRGED